MTGILRVPRRAALAAIAVLVAGASLVSFAESYRGLYLWAHAHGLAGIWSVIWPLQVDVFIAVGELALFVALADQWPSRSRTAAWAVTLGGLAVSVAGNVGHIAGHSLADRATAAIPPLAAASALAVGLGVLKRVVAGHRAGADHPEPAVAQDAPPAPASQDGALAAYRASVASGEPLSARQLAARHGISRRQAGQVVAQIAASANGHAGQWKQDQDQREA
jgi:uncharacterized protein DUF2637